MNKNPLTAPASISFQKNICRACLCKITVLNSTDIFSDEEFLNGQSLRQVFTGITCTLLDPLEKLPSRMCLECVERLKSAVSFKINIEEAEKTLRFKLRVAESNFYMGRTDSIESMLDSFCDEIYSLYNKDKNHNAVHANTKHEKLVTPNKNSIRIINQTNKDNATLTSNINAKKRNSSFKTFNGKDFIENFLNQQDERHKPIGDLTVEFSNCEKVYTNKKKNNSSTPEGEQNQYILIVQEVPDLIQEKLIMDPPQLEDEVVVMETPLPEIIEIPDSPDPAIQEECDKTTSDNVPVMKDCNYNKDPILEIPIINTSSDDKLAAEMAWIENNLEDLGTVTADDKIGCNKCNKRFTISKDNNQGNTKDSLDLKYNQETKTYMISISTDSSSKIMKDPSLCACETVEMKNNQENKEVLKSKKRSYLSNSDSDMPVTKLSKKTWNNDHMMAAIKAYKENPIGFSQCAKEFDVPKTTLARYVKHGVPDSRATRTKHLFSDDIETEIIQHALEIKDLFYEVTRDDLRKIAYDLCKKHNICTNRCSPTEERVDTIWLTNFLSRKAFLLEHLSKQKKDSYISNVSYSSQLIKTFLDMYKTNLNRINSNPRRTYSYYELGAAISVQQKKKEVAIIKGKQQILNLSPFERNTLINSLVCFNAVGNFIPPSVIYSHQHMKSGLISVLPAGSLLISHTFGWIQENTFLQWLQHFINHVKPTADDPVILLINSRASYVRSIEVVQLAKNNYVLLTALPPYQVYNIEPAEKGFVFKFQLLYKHKYRLRLKSHIKQTPSGMGRLFACSYVEAATSTVGTCGFIKSNLFPLRENKILANKKTNLKEKEDSSKTSNDQQNTTKQEEELASCCVKEDVKDVDVLEHFDHESNSLNISIKEETDVKTCVWDELEDTKVKKEMNE